MTLQNRVPLAEAQSGLARLIEQLRQGEDIVLVENGVEVARLVAPTAGATIVAGEERKTKRRGGFWAGQIKEIDPDWWKPENDLTYLFECLQEEPDVDGEPRSPASP